VLNRGDSVVVVLPKDDKVIRASRTDPLPVTRLAGSEGLTDAQFMGAVTGSFLIDRFRGPATLAAASSDAGISILRLSEGGTVYEFEYTDSLEAVTSFVQYRDGRKSREVIRGQFERIESLPRALKTVYRDYEEDREITVSVVKEEVNPQLPEEAFQLLLP